MAEGSLSRKETVGGSALRGERCEGGVKQAQEE